MSEFILPLPNGFVIAKIVGSSCPIVIKLEPEPGTLGRCPTCGQGSQREHSRYQRSFKHVSWGSVPVEVQITVRRFFCDAVGCSTHIFCERLEGFAPTYGRRSQGFTAKVESLGFCMSARAATKTCGGLGYPTSLNTVLRILRAVPDPEQERVRVAGIDDWAWRKGSTYGTIVVDQERHRVIDLLPDREETTISSWLSSHPEIQIVTRDRDGTYAHAARTGAPQAQQVADRWHLLHNLKDALKRMIANHPPKLPALDVPVKEAMEQTPSQPIEHETPLTAAQRRRVSLYEAVQAMRREGMSISEISRRLHLRRGTVGRYASLPTCPTRRSQVPSILDAWESTLMQLQDDGVQSARELFRQICEMGFKGSYQTVYEWARRTRGPRRTSREEPPQSRIRLTPTSLSHLLLLPQDHVPRTATAPLSALIASDDMFKKAYTITQHFHAMINHQHGQALDAWLALVDRSDIPELQSFAKSLRRDLAAVTAGLTEPWSQGLVEGFNNKLKFLKRTMFGRSKFDLLRKRILHAS